MEFQEVLRLFGVFSCCVLASGSAGGDVLSTLFPSHPRLFLHDDALARLKQMYGKDERLRRLVDGVLRNADETLNLPLPRRKLIGPRLLHVSREVLRRVQVTALAYRWTGDERYAECAVRNMLAACDFKDWNPSHFLDVAEMTNAVGLGYDWLYSYMDESTRRRVRERLVTLGLKEGIKAYERGNWFFNDEFNWNLVCNGGLLVGALAVAESEPDISRRVVDIALRCMPRAIATYDPDGAWPEGPAYWHYATLYLAYGLSVLETALGSDMGLSHRKGLSRAARFPLMACGPTGRYLCFADAHNGARRRPMAETFYLAGKFHDDAAARMEHEMLRRHKGTAFHVVWYRPLPEGVDVTFPLDCIFRGKVPVMFFRSGWDSDALFVGVKGGYNQVNHGHLDLGNFELDALGSRWMEDLGSDYYNLPGYWDMRRGGRRWKYFRLNSLSHNVITIDGHSQDPYGKSEVVSFHAAERPEGEAFCIIDLTSAYTRFARRAMRGVAMVARRRAVIVRDEITLKGRHRVSWHVTTAADVRVESPHRAVFSSGGKELEARLLEPADGAFSVVSAEQSPPQARNEGYKQLVVEVEKEGRVDIEVLFVPRRTGAVVPEIKPVSLDAWPQVYR